MAERFTEEEWEDSVLECTSPGPAWAIVKKGLANEIYAAQANALDSKTWEQVCELKGFAQGIAYMMNLRDNVVLRRQQRAEEARLDANV
jgi:hypothetical protein